MYHYELRKFPHAVCRYNQSEEQLRSVLIPWVAEQWFEEGEQKWNSNEATLTVLEGRELSMPDLAMGRGWRNAQRRSEDVTERVLAAARKEGEAVGVAARPAGAAAGVASPGVQRAAETAAPLASGAAADPQLLADSLALALLGLLDDQAVALSRVWRLAAKRLGDASSAESLALAERAVRLLVGRGLAVLCESATAGARAEHGDAHAMPTIVATERIDEALRAVDSWGGGGHAGLQLARNPS